MKKVTLLKAHLEHKAGDTIEVTDERANYLKRVHAAKDYVAPPPPPPPAAKKADPAPAPPPVTDKPTPAK